MFVFSLLRHVRCKDSSSAKNLLQWRIYIVTFWTPAPSAKFSCIFGPLGVGAPLGNPESAVVKFTMLTLNTFNSGGSKLQFLGKFGKFVCWRPPGELAPPRRGNPGSATVQDEN